MYSEKQIDLMYDLKTFDPDSITPEDDLRAWISDRDIRWLIDHYDLARLDARVYSIRYLWQYPNYSKKQRWLIINLASEKEKSFYK